MDKSVEREGTSPGKPLDARGIVSRHILKQIEEEHPIAALQLVAALRRKRLPTLPKLWIPDPTNPTKKIEEADALIIGERHIKIHGRIQNVTLIALFPAVAEGKPVEETSCVEFRSYGQLISEQVPGGTLLVPSGLPSETHQSIFTNAGKVKQGELIKLTLEAIYPQPTG